MRVSDRPEAVIRCALASDFFVAGCVSSANFSNTRLKLEFPVIDCEQMFPGYGSRPNVGHDLLLSRSD